MATRTDLVHEAREREREIERELFLARFLEHSRGVMSVPQRADMARNVFGRVLTEDAIYVRDHRARERQG